MVLSLQQRDVIHRPGCYQDGRFVVVERVSVVSDNDDFHVDHLLSALFIKVHRQKYFAFPLYIVLYRIKIPYRYSNTIRIYDIGGSTWHVLE